MDEPCTRYRVRIKFAYTIKSKPMAYTVRINIISAKDSKSLTDDKISRARSRKKKMHFSIIFH